MKVALALASAAFLLCAVPAGAQSPSPAPVPGVPLPFTVYVLDRSGGETEGRLVSLTEATVTIQTKTAPRTFSLSEVVRIYQRGDSLKNGALIGGGFGLGMGLLLGGFSDCPGADQSKGCPWSHVGFIVVGTLTYAAIGTAIDALIPGRTLLWWAQPGQNAGGGLMLNVSPRTRSVLVGWRIR